MQQRKFPNVTLYYLGHDVAPSSRSQQAVIDRWMQRTGATVIPLYPANINVATVEAESDFSSGINLYDVITFGNAKVVDWAEKDYLADLTDASRESIILQWTDILPIYRTKLSSYNGRVLCSLIDGDSFIFYYRKDIFDANKISVPESWDDMLSVAERLKGRDLNNDTIPDYPICLTNDILAEFQMLTIMNSMLHHESSMFNGMIFDVDRNNKEPMKLLFDTEGFRETLRTYKALHSYSAPGKMAFGDMNGLFRQGRCAMYMSLPSGGTFAAVPGAYLRGKLGVALTPGSRKVYNRNTQKMETCTPALCPMMTASGVNRPVFYAAGGVSLAVNKRSKNLDAAIDLGFTMSAEVDVRAPGQMLNPFRHRHFNVTWFVQGGWDSSDATAYLNGLQQSLLSDHVFTDLRVPAARDAQIAIVECFQRYLGIFQNVTTAISVEEAARCADRIFRQTLAAKGLTWTKIEEIHRKSLGMPPLMEPESLNVESSNVVSIVVPIAVIFAGLVSVLFGYIKYQAWKLRTRTRDISMAPQGNKIAIMFTDVQQSTKLWNANKAAMEKAVQLHHQIIRQLITKHKGYEVKTIGDSFMVVHADPSALLRIAFDVQKGLLSLNWPNDVLISQDGCVETTNEGKVLYRGLRIRIGLHYGEVNKVFDEVAKGYDYYGDAVNCAARVESLAFGGQVLCTKAFLDEVDAALKAGLRSTYMGPILLKGLKEPVPITEVGDPELPRDFNGVREVAESAAVMTDGRKPSLIADSPSDKKEKNVDKMGLLEARGEILRLRSVLAASSIAQPTEDSPTNQPKIN